MTRNINVITIGERMVENWNWDNFYIRILDLGVISGFRMRGWVLSISNIDDLVV